MHDPNFLGPQSSSLFLFPACSSNDNGEITGLGVTTAGEFRDYLLTPIPWSANPSELFGIVMMLRAGKPVRECNFQEGGLPGRRTCTARVVGKQKVIRGRDERRSTCLFRRHTPELDPRQRPGFAPPRHRDGVLQHRSYRPHRRNRRSSTKGTRRPNDRRGRWKIERPFAWS